MSSIKFIPPKFTSYQKAILDSPARFTITESSTKAGKTISHIFWLYMKAHEMGIDQSGKHYWWVANVYSQSKIAFKRLRRFLAPFNMYSFNESSLTINCPNGSVIEFKTAEKPDNLYGEDVYACVFDEAPRARVEAFYALRTTLSSTGGSLKMIGNFGGISNWMHQLKEKAKFDDNYEYFKITCWDAIKEGVLDEMEVKQAQKDLPPKVFASLYEAEPIEDDGQLISNESIQKIFSNTHIEGGTKFITCDPAFTGRDKAVIMLWDGFRVEQIVSYDSSDINVLVERINQLKSEFNVNGNNIIVDADGVGAGVVSYLGGSLRFNNGGKPIGQSKRNFTNIKNQCYFKLVDKINANEIYIDCDQKQERTIMEELEWVRLPKEIDDHKIQIMSKEEVKKRLGRSPDYSDCLMLRMRKEVGGTGIYNVGGMTQFMNDNRGIDTKINRGAYKVI